jgi:hypothetical protein
MLLDCPRRQVQAQPDLAVTESLGEQLQDLVFPDGDASRAQPGRDVLGTLAPLGDSHSCPAEHRPARACDRRHLAFVEVPFRCPKPLDWRPPAISDRSLAHQPKSQMTARPVGATGTDRGRRRLGGLPRPAAAPGEYRLGELRELAVPAEPTDGRGGNLVVLG